MSMHVPNQYRIRSGAFGTDDSYGNNGAFFVPTRPGRLPLKVIASDGLTVPDERPELAGWEHVSASLPERCPTWAEMCRIKDLFWDDEDTVVQFHPPRSQYVNNHPYCLHLWRPLHAAVPLPPAILVGVVGTLAEPRT